MMLPSSDIFLGWTKGVQANRFLCWRQLRDMKGSALVDTMSAFMLEFYAGIGATPIIRPIRPAPDVIECDSKSGMAAAVSSDPHRYRSVVCPARDY